jgi:hypothetical protein
VARTRITRNNCRVGRIRYARSRRSLRGRVIAQVPRGGVTKPAGTGVKLVVGRR